jgi:hypothetical protein
MEKLGVQLDKEAVETAKATNDCPQCGRDLLSVNPPKCGKCGTLPFEAKTEEK